MRAERRLAPPDGEHDLALHADLLLDLGEIGGVLRSAGCGPARLRLREVAGVEVFGRRAGELGLALHLLGLPGQHEIGNRQVGFDAAERGMSKVARETPMPCASGHSSLDEAAELVGWTARRCAEPATETAAAR